LIHQFWLKSWLEEKSILHHLVTPNKWKPSYLMKAKFSWCNNNDFLFSREIYDIKLEDFYQNNTIEYTWLDEEDFDSLYNNYLAIKI
jgi:hypothetical protein